MIQPPTLNYEPPPVPPINLSVADYLLAAIGAVFIFFAAFVLLSIFVAILTPKLADPWPILLLVLAALGLSVAAAINSFRSTLARYRARRQRLASQYSMPQNFRK